MTWQPDLTVAAVIQREDRFLLVEERIAGRLVLNQPAGHVEDGEALIDAVVRETREETAWLFTPRHLLGTYLWRNPDSHITSLRFAFIGEVCDHRPGQKLDDGIVATRWLRWPELQQASVELRSPLVLRCIDDFLAGQRFDLACVTHLIEAGATAPRSAQR